MLPLLLLSLQIAMVLVMQIFTASTSYASSSNWLAQVGIYTQDILKFTSFPDQNQNIVYEFKIYWKYLDQAVSDGIKHDCGVKWLTPLISLDTDDNNIMKTKGVNCSFTKDNGMVNMVFPRGTQLKYLNGNFIEISTSSFKGDQELCTLRLRGYEKFQRVFAAYVFDEDKLTENSIKFFLIKFPEGFTRLANRSFNDFVLFNPNEGKGKRFKHTKKCLELLIGNQPIEKIYENCIIECEDFDEDLGNSPLDRRIEL